MIRSLLGWARFAWQSDYGQFYLIDCQDHDFAAPVEITPDIESRGLSVMPSGIVVYTQDSLQQHISISIVSDEPEPLPAEPMSGKPWTRRQTAQVHFPSRRFYLSSPSTPAPLPNGPIFLVESMMSTIRISWMEFQGSRDDSVPVEPDVIDIAMWPSR